MSLVRGKKKQEKCCPPCPNRHSSTEPPCLSSQTHWDHPITSPHHTQTNCYSTYKKAPCGSRPNFPIPTKGTLSFTKNLYLDASQLGASNQGPLSPGALGRSLWHLRPHPLPHLLLLLLLPPAYICACVFVRVCARLLHPV